MATCLFLSDANLKMADIETEEMKNESSMMIGRRCAVDKHRGTIKFMGEVPPTSGNWYGIEWDEERGKHDGSHSGVRYFTSRSGHGSFVRPAKLNFGISIIEALDVRYGKNDDYEDKDLFVTGKGNQKTAVEMVGFEKIQDRQSQLENLRKVGLRNLFVSSCGEPGRLQQIAYNIRDLDVSQNLLSSWQEVAQITKQLPHLEILNVSENRLHLPEEGKALCDSFKTIKILYTNRMELDWNQVNSIVLMAVSVTQLHVCFNNIKHITIQDPEVFQNIQLLNLEGNKVSDWSEVLNLSAVKRLETLILNDNLISEVYFDNSDTKVDGAFDSLKAISLSRNKISKWKSINELNHFRCLSDVRFKENPLIEGETGFNTRQELIGRLGKASTVNGSSVLSQERKQAEVAYLKKYWSNWLNAGGKDSDFTGDHVSLEFKSEHPRYLKLLTTYGPPPEGMAAKVKTLKEKLIQIKFKCPDCQSKKEVTKKIPATMTVQQLKSLLQRLYKVNSSDQKLSYADTKNGREIEIDDSLRELSFYSISSGDTILIRW